jgi:PAS domain S-box-containing protein
MKNTPRTVKLPSNLRTPAKHPGAWHRLIDALRDSEERYHVLYDQTPSMYFTVDANGTVLSVNRFGADQLGYAPEELIGKSVLAVFPDGDRDAAKRHLETCLTRPNEVHHWELRKVRRDGAEMWARETARTIVGADGNLLILVVCEDITERRRAEEALRIVSEETAPQVGANFFQSLVHHLAKALHVRFAFISELCLEDRQRVCTLAWWTGTEYGENFEYALAGTPCAEVFLNDGTYYPREVQQRFPKDRWLAIQGIESYLAVPLYDRDKNPIGHLGVMHDGPMADDLPRENILRILASRAAAELERARAEEALRKSEEHFRNLVEGSIAGILIHRDWKPLFVNQAYAEMHGYESTDAILALDSIGSRIAPHERARLRGYREARLRGEAAPVQYEYEALRKNGATIVLRNLVRLVNWHGELAVQNTLIDITERHDSEVALRASEVRFRSLFEQSNDAVIIHTVVGNILDANSRACEMLGYDCFEFMSMRIPSLYPQADQEAAKTALKFLEDKESIRFESRFRRANGEEIDVEISARIIDHEAQVVQAIVRDITDRKRVDGALRRFERMVSASTDLMAFVDRTYTYRAINAAYSRAFGKEKDELIGRCVAEMFGTKIFERRIKPHLDRCLAGGHVNYQNWLRVSGRGRRFLDVHYDPFIDDDGVVSGVVADIRDITEWKHAEAMLREYQKQLRTLASQMSLAEERERRRIAIELHDRTVQNLGLSQIKLGALRNALLGTPHVEDARAIQGLIDQIICEARSLVFELSPPILYELGFAPAIEWLAERWQEHNGVSCKLEGDCDSRLLDKNVQVMLFQAVRELLSNVGKHAHASEASIRLCEQGDVLVICVEDDGAGFNAPVVTPGAVEQGGFGLFSIRERLSMLGGRLEVDSTLGRGTRVMLTVPLGSHAGA